MSSDLSVNPEVLRWARETAGLRLDDVARRMHKEVAEIEGWESADLNQSPTYIQLESLAYNLYKRPIAIFFFPEPPSEDTPAEAFRTLPKDRIAEMSPRMRYLIRQSQVMRLNLKELTENSPPSKKRILDHFSFNAKTPPEEMAAVVREYFQVDLRLQSSWKNEDAALKEWRNELEAHGVFVFKESFNQRVGRASIESQYSGFCLYDRDYPIIYVNNSKSKNRQIFTLFHELAHLLLGTGGVDTRLEDYIDRLSGDNKLIELACNQFAGSFLVPDDDFNARKSSYSTSPEDISSLAKYYNVSREVVLRKFFDRGEIDQYYYDRMVSTWKAARRKRPKPPWGDPYATKGVYLGDTYLSLAFRQYFRNKFSKEQLAGYLGVKVKHLPEYEARVIQKASTE
ncbi:MAG: ImmA/IrrE family metallo-endopeptidase [Candidatus Neomarinimicrobiota bacterium]